MHIAVAAKIHKKNVDCKLVKLSRNFGIQKHSPVHQSRVIKILNYSKFRVKN